ncbi:hypothetical protein [Anaeromicropila herbilytica]|uniref:Metallo-beta-lactamase domain-containing protein n=1 Tax=Anaeromicropila herbilytica TaxID=2785025 RepID=A0A7R7IDX6_9FIRM|nr:hypothetical protein [Anaeromicropila herbilytica]BCN32178.1 hypothetical protein bsdtb5_34730 [Anaeromicropila herbilytica]
MDYVKIWCIAVGPGVMNFVEIYDKTTNQVKGLILIDCGGSQSIYEKVSSRLVDSILARNNNFINLVLISHTNAEYSNLLSELEVDMNGLIFGGSNDSYKQSSLKETIATLVDAEFLEKEKVFISDSSSYSRVVGSLDLSVFGIDTDVILRLLISDSEVGGKDASSIWQITVGSHYTLFTADASIQTIQKANGIIGENLTYFTGTSICDLMTIPHHGSYVIESKEKVTKLDPSLKVFGTYINARYGIANSALHRNWIYSSQYVQEAVLPNPVAMARHICYIHNKSNVYGKRQYTTGYLTNSSVIEGEDRSISYSLKMDGTSQNVPQYYKENDTTPQDDFTHLAANVREEEGVVYGPE